MLSRRKHLVRSSGFHFWLKRSAFAVALGFLGVVTIAVPLHAGEPITLPEGQTDRPALFALCTGKPRPAPGSDLMARDHDCAVLVDGLARVFDRTGEFLNLLHVQEIKESPKDAEKRQIEADFNQIGGEMIFAAPLILCEAFNDRRLVRHTDSGSCLNYDERMDGSALDLAALIDQNPDKLPHFEAIAPPPGDPQSNDALAEIARARFLHQYPIGSSTEKATAWLQSLGFACENDECRFPVDKWAYYPGNAGFGSYEWVIAFRPRAGRRSAVGTIANLEVRLLDGPYP